eukprot:SAG31_NODE_6417_length_2027_cov_19.380705_2_plen_145_part_00
MRTRRRRRQQAPIRPPQQRLCGSTIKAGHACKLTSPSTASRPLSMKGARASRIGNLPAPDTSRRKMASFTGERQQQPYGRQRQWQRQRSDIYISVERCRQTARIPVSFCGAGIFCFACTAAMTATSHHSSTSSSSTPSGTPCPG